MHKCDDTLYIPPIKVQKYMNMYMHVCTWMYLLVLKRILRHKSACPSQVTRIPAFHEETNAVNEDLPHDRKLC